MIAFFHQAWLSYKALFNWQGPVMFAMNVLFRPLLYIAIFSFFGRFARGDDAAGSFAVGMAMWSAVVVVGVRGIGRSGAGEVDEHLVSRAVHGRQQGPHAPGLGGALLPVGLARRSCRAWRVGGAVGYRRQCGVPGVR